jgi:murein L,D-transpeptidase YcbB/YkuD
MRWLEDELPERYVLVNIPSQTLSAYDNGKLAFDMNVVVGLPFRQTKTFHTDIHGVRFNPTWSVPMGLKMSDFLPKLRKDPLYMSDKGLKFIRGYGRDAVHLDPTKIDWNAMTWRDMANLRLVQTSGDENALGRIRILMDDEYDIYMHDTNHKEFFAKTQRTYSSGCVRLSEPEKMARFVLNRNDGGWSQAKIQEAVASGETFEVDAAPTPVYIVYRSIWLGRDGHLVYGADVYKQDEKLIALLKAADAFHIPQRAPQKPDIRYADAGTEAGQPVLASVQ